MRFFLIYMLDINNYNHILFTTQYFFRFFLVLCAKHPGAANSTPECHTQFLFFLIPFYSTFRPHSMHINWPSGTFAPQIHVLNDVFPEPAAMLCTVDSDCSNCSTLAPHLEQNFSVLLTSFPQIQISFPLSTSLPQFGQKL